MEWIRGETIGYGSFSTVSLATTSGRCNSSEFPSLMAVKSSGLVSSAALRNEKHVFDYLGDDCSQIVRCFGDETTMENGEEIYNLFLEYASAGNLANRVRKSGRGLPEFDVRRITKSILKGLRHIHSRGFSHCDLKLENILIFGDGEVKISDFGLAKKVKSEDRKRIGDEIRVEIRGTPLYMAPESVNRNDFESPVDIWGLGCCVVEMSSGETAWCLQEGTNLMSLMFRIGAGDEIPRIPMELSEEGKDFLRKCLVRNPAERWTAEMLLDHPFLAVDDNDDDESSGLLWCGEEDEELVSLSPRDPFDFPDWNSVQSPVNESVKVNYLPFRLLVRSAEERMRGLVTERGPDWSVSDGWVNVR